jgi:hypothetical protein
MPSSRRRSRLGAQRRAACSVSARVCIHAVGSAASATIAHQIWLAANACNGRLASPGVLGGADAVLGAGAATVPQLEVGQLPPCRVGDERGDPVPVDVGDAQLSARVGALAAHDQPHPRRPAGQVEHPGGGSGFVYVIFVMDVFSRRIVG